MENKIKGIVRQKLTEILSDFQRHVYVRCLAAAISIFNLKRHHPLHLKNQFLHLAFIKNYLWWIELPLQ
jgi:hypothetical protein